MIEKKEKRKAAGRPQIWFSRCVSIKVPEEDLDLLKAIALGMHRNPELRKKFRNILENGANQMTRSIELPPNTLLHTFSCYNAIVEASDGTLVHWNNTLGFSDRDEEDDDELTHELTPFVNIEGMANIRAAVDAFVEAQSSLEPEM